MKKTICFILSILLLAAPLSALAAPATGAFHISYSGTASVYGENNYLYDTLTVAGSGVGSVQAFTVCDLETMALDKSLNLGYENTYSMLTSGKVFTKPVMTGLKLYDFLLTCGLDKTLPDETPVKTVAKDGYTISFTLGQLRAGGARYSSMDNTTPEEKSLPVLLAFESNGLPLVGPTGSEAVYKTFTAADGYDKVANNIGGPIRLVCAQSASTEFNAPNCSKWLAAIIIGDADGYVYNRSTGISDDSSEPKSGGDWTHKGTYSDYTLTIRGSEALRAVKLGLSELEAMDDIKVRGYFASSAGKNAYEGIVLNSLVKKHLADGIDVPKKVTIVATDGYRKTLDMTDLINGIDSRYQPGKHKDIILAYAVDGSPLVKSADSPGYNGNNAYGPLRLIVENTVSAWVKNVSEIIIGEDNNAALPFTDTGSCVWANEAINYLYSHSVVSGTTATTFSPDKSISRGDFMVMLYRAYNLGSLAKPSGNFSDVAVGSYYYDAIATTKALGIATGSGDGSFNPTSSITREDAMTLLYRTLVKVGKTPSTTNDISSFTDKASVISYALDSIKALVGAGVINGSDGKLDPQGTMTRAQMAQALYKALTKLT